MWPHSMREPTDKKYLEHSLGGSLAINPPKNLGSQPEICLPCPPSWSEKVQVMETVLLVPSVPPHRREVFTEGNLKWHVSKQYYFNFSLLLKHEGTWNWKIQKERRNHKTIFWVFSFNISLCPFYTVENIQCIWLLHPAFVVFHVYFSIVLRILCNH